MITGARVLSIRTASGRAAAALVEQGGATFEISFSHIVLAAGAVNTAALLLRSDPSGPGLANSSGLVGRNYMVHNSTFMSAVDPRRRNTTKFQKTLGSNHWYSAGADAPYPLGNVQMLGKLQTPMARAAKRHVPRVLLDAMTARSIDLYLTTEDLPSRSNGVRLQADGSIGIEWTPTNVGPHRELVARMRTVMRKSGYPLVFTERMGIATNSHMCGTAVMGSDPATSVIDSTGRSFDVDNLWIADSSVFPSSAALNPALTIAACAMRTADHLAHIA
jgi:choline dehydrogenase-like flavoprotein